jgi:hypothetical protein
MNTFSYQLLYPDPITQEPLDWLDYTWGGPFPEDDDEEELLLLPIYGPVNRDGLPLGFLYVLE